MWVPGRGTCGILGDVLIASWNVNSLKARLPRVLEFLDTHEPDVLLLQETKANPGQVPLLDLEQRGYTAADHSAGRWAGVAVVSRSDTPPTDVVRGLPGEHRPDEARWIEATVDGIRFASVYVPNGRALDDPAYIEKLGFLDGMVERAAALPRPVIVCGDLNIARSDADVYDPGLFVGTTHTSAPERERFERLLDTGLVDAFRALEPDGPGFTWWDYRAGHFHKKLGMRIDYALVSEDVADGIVHCNIDRNFRKGPKPSDHAPLLLELAG